jgi:hypothetical protein
VNYIAIYLACIIFLKIFNQFSVSCLVNISRQHIVKVQNLQDLEAILVTGRGGLYGCKTSRLPHFVDNRLTVGGEVVSLTRLQLFTPEEDSWYSFLLESESAPGP